MLAVRRVLKASAGIGPDHPKRLWCHFIWGLTLRPDVCDTLQPNAGPSKAISGRNLRQMVPARQRVDWLEANPAVTYSYAEPEWRQVMTNRRSIFEDVAQQLSLIHI